MFSTDVCCLMSAFVQAKLSKLHRGDPGDVLSLLTGFRASSNPFLRPIGLNGLIVPVERDIHTGSVEEKEARKIAKMIAEPLPGDLLMLTCLMGLTKSFDFEVAADTANPALDMEYRFGFHQPHLKSSDKTDTQGRKARQKIKAMLDEAGQSVFPLLNMDVTEGGDREKLESLFSGYTKGATARGAFMNIHRQISSKGMERKEIDTGMWRKLKQARAMQDACGYQGFSELMGDEKILPNLDKLPRLVEQDLVDVSEGSEVKSQFFPDHMDQLLMNKVVVTAAYEAAVEGPDASRLVRKVESLYVPAWHGYPPGAVISFIFNEGVKIWTEFQTTTDTDDILTMCKQQC